MGQDPRILIKEYDELTVVAAWSKHHENVGLSIAASIFVGAGVILLYILNLIYARRIFRAYHPKHGNGKPAEIAFKAYFISIVLTLVMGKPIRTIF